MRKIALLILTIAALAVVSLFMSAPVQAQTDIEGILDCPYTDAAYYQPGVFPRYEAPGQRVVLVSWLTGEDVQVLDTGVNVAAFFGQSWSPDCRYLAVGMGTVDSLDSVVYDVAENRRVGSVPDAHQQPHHVTWGPDGYLVVETRIGGVLWNVAANSQHVLTTSWNTTTHRNFSRLRWDAANGQLIANLAVGGRVVYDLATALEIPEAENVIAEQPNYRGAPTGHVLIGGREYACYSGYADGFGLHYDIANQAVSIVMTGMGRLGESILMLEDGLAAGSFRVQGWSASCRYVVASVGVPGEDVSATVAWDVIERRRVGAFPDAQQVDHPITWSQVDDALVVTTRNGAYLWYLPEDRRTQLTTTVAQPLTRWGTVRGYSDLRWNRETGQLFIVPLEATGEVRAYDVPTGALIGTYAAQAGRVPDELPALHTTINAATPSAAASAQHVLPVNPVEGISGTTQRAYDGRWWWDNRSTSDAFCRATIQIDEDEQGYRSIRVGPGLENGIVVVADLGSPDCRYVGLKVSWSRMTPTAYDGHPLDDTFSYRQSDTLILFDAVTGERLQEFANPYQAYSSPAIWWSPGGDRALIRTTSGFYLWHPASNAAALLTFAGGRSDVDSYPQVYWDYSHGQILISGWDAVYAFDMRSGDERYVLTHVDNYGASCGHYWWGGCRFTVSEDQTTLFVGAESVNSLGIWNLETLEHAFIDVENFGNAPATRRIAISPDHRYVAMAHRMVRIWDLSAAPNEDGTIPVINRFDAAAGRWSDSVRFVSETVIETTDYYDNVVRWDILTGEEVALSATSE